MNANTTARPQNYREDVRHRGLLRERIFAKPVGIFSIPARRNFAGHRAPRVNVPRAVPSQTIFAYFGPDLSDCSRLPRFSSGGGVWALGERSA